MDDELYHGIVCLIRFTDGEKNYWELQKAGRIQVTGAGMTWLEMIPDDTLRVMTVMYFPDGTHDPERKHYPVTADQRYQPSVWYFDDPRVKRSLDDFPFLRRKQNRQSDRPISYCWSVYPMT